MIFYWLIAIFKIKTETNKLCKKYMVFFSDILDWKASKMYLETRIINCNVTI